jgi:general secretion pathway protein K
MKPRTASPKRQRGAAILLAMLIMTLVATLAAGMVWMQWRGIEVETAERARGQGEWLLNAALDWGNLILKSSARNSYKDDDLGQPWATPLAETKLSSFLSADGSHSEDSGPEAFLTGQITDAQSKYNLYDLFVGDAAANKLELARFEILCNAIGVAESTATALASGLSTSWTAQKQEIAEPTQKDTSNAVLMPRQLTDLAWYGIDPATILQLTPYIQILPTGTATTINVNTAPAEVLMAAFPGISRSQAQQLISRRQSQPFTSVSDAATLVAHGTGYTPATGVPADQASVKSNYFEIYGQLRYEQHVIRERSVVNRISSTSIAVIRRERVAPDAP